MPESKSTIRQHFLGIRKNISAKDAESASLKAAGNFLKSIPLDNIKTIAIYYPANGETSPLPLMELVKKKGISFCLPVVKAKYSPLEFYKWAHGEDLVNNQFYPGLLEPKLQNNPLTPDLIVVPLVAFDEKLHRLGYGAGFYDRTIEAIRESKSLRTVGYAFEIQKHPELLPVDGHDIQLDFIVTDKIIRP